MDSSLPLAAFLAHERGSKEKGKFGTLGRTRPPKAILFNFYVSRHILMTAFQPFAACRPKRFPGPPPPSLSPPCALAKPAFLQLSPGEVCCWPCGPPSSSPSLSDVTTQVAKRGRRGGGGGFEQVEKAQLQNSRRPSSEGRRESLSGAPQTFLNLFLFLLPWGHKTLGLAPPLFSGRIEKILLHHYCYTWPQNRGFIRSLSLNRSRSLKQTC